MECPVCKKEFNPDTGRRPKKFCSDTCKVKYWNAVKKVNKNNEPENKTKIEEERETVSEVSQKAKNPLDGKQGSKFKTYDYSAMPAGLTYSGREAWKKKARAEQDNL